MRKIGIIGGGLAGLTLAILLRRQGHEIYLFERKEYPFHRVCGEYVSLEVLELLKHLKLPIDQWSLPLIDQLSVTSVSGKTLNAPLDLGGIGISRFKLDAALADICKNEGVQLYTNTKVDQFKYQAEADKFELTASNGAFEFDYLVGTFGKRSNIDNFLDRPFFRKRQPYFGVKYHVKTEPLGRLIELHNFEGGYCGISDIEEEKTCICYLSKVENLKKHGNITAMEEAVLFKNKLLAERFKRSEFLFDKPVVINEISFERKSLVQDHLLFCGDAAGMITPLCGNGMSMAMHAALILASCFQQLTLHNSRLQLEVEYQHQWQQAFATRLWWGRAIQRFFGDPVITDSSLAILKNIPVVQRKLISLTHGKVIQI